jgi:hypothetical protein
VFVKVWYTTSSYAIFTSDGIKISEKPPAVTTKQGKVVSMQYNVYLGRVIVMVFNATFNNISFISWLLMNGAYNFNLYIKGNCS